MFALYQTVSGGAKWQFVQVVGIAGLLVDQILRDAMTKQPDLTGRIGWELSGRDLRLRVVQSSLPPTEHDKADEYRLVIDATYTRKDAVLFEICHVWGYADPDWSPLALRLSQVGEVARSKGPSTPIDLFQPEGECRTATDFVHEFLYLQHGYQTGTQKNWGRTGYTNAALLWPAHLEHLLGKIGFTRK